MVTDRQAAVRRRYSVEQSIRSASVNFGFSFQALDYSGLRALLDVAPVAVGAVPKLKGLGGEGGEDAGTANDLGLRIVAPSPTSAGKYDVDPEFKSTKSAMFLQVLTKELQRIEDVVRQKTQPCQLRTQKIVADVDSFCSSADDLDSTSRDADAPLIRTQLSTVYDEVVLVLWFACLNSESASEIVNLYNGCFPEHTYSLDAARFSFVSTSLDILRGCRRSLDDAHGRLRCAADCGGESLGGSDISLIDESLQELMDGVCDDRKETPSVGVASERKAGKRRWHAYTACPQRLPVWRDPRLAVYKPIQVVGSGAYGTVVEVRCKRTGERRAVKTIHGAFDRPVLAQRAYREVLVLLRSAHPHIVRLLDVAVDPNGTDLHLVFPLARQTAEHAHRSKRLLPVHRAWILYQLLHALAYLHSRGVVHRDLKLSNLLLHERAEMKLADFGSARTLVDGCTREHMTDCPDYIQTQWYRAPEVLLCAAEVTTAADMWSVGCIIVELLTGVPAFPGQDPQHQLELVLSYTGIPGGDTLTDMKSPLAPLLLYQAGYMNGARPRRSKSQELPVHRETQSAHAAVLPCRSLDDLLRRQDYGNQSSPAASGRGSGSSGRDATSPSGDGVPGAEAVCDLMRKCLLFDPKTRISARKALCHRWFVDTVPHSARQAAVAEASVSAGAKDALSLPLSCSRLCSVLEYKLGVEQCARELRRENTMHRQSQAAHTDPCGCVVS